MLWYISTFIIQPLGFLIRFIDPTMRTSAKAGADAVDLAINTAHPKERGYFTLLNKDISAPQSLDEKTQQRLWTETLEWANITPRNTALTEGFQQ